MPDDEHKSPLQRLHERLYRKNEDFSEKSHHLREQDFPVEDGWRNEEEVVSLMPHKKMSFSVKIFIAAVAFFVVALGISLTIFWGGGNLVSTKNVVVTTTGPVSVEAGKEFSFDILIENKNNADLELADLLLEYPEGARISRALEKGLSRTRTALGTIHAGQVFRSTIRTALFGQEGDAKEIKATLEYRVAGSNAIFVAEKTYSVSISSSPINLSLKSAREIVSGQEFELAVELTSNSTDIAKNLLLSVEYPFGFSFIDATPSPSYGNNVWKIGDLAPSSSRTIHLRGTLQGQDGDEKVFKIGSGMADPQDERTIGTLYGSSLGSVSVVRPSLGIELSLGGQTLPEFIISPGRKNSAQITWANNTPTKIVDAHIEAHLTGEVLDKQSVSTEDGFYRSVDTTIIWDKSTVPALASLEPGARGSVQFVFSPLGAGGQPRGLIDPAITIDVSVTGERLAPISGEGSVKNTLSRVARVNSEVGITGRGLYYSGAFPNTGPIPPKVEKETTYTIVWTVANSSNVVRQSEVTATVPPYVRWVGNFSPQNEQISFSAPDRTVHWKLGDVGRGTGIVSPAREVSFQIAFLPSLSQVGQTPLLVSPALLQGVDGWTGASLSASSKAIDTRLDMDTRFKLDDDKVVP